MNTVVFSWRVSYSVDMNDAVGQDFAEAAWPDSVWHVSVLSY